MKQVKENNKSTREVLTEKSRRYHYKTDEGSEGGDCMEKCMIREKFVMIGSYSCCKCIHNEYYDDENGYIICGKIREATGKK